MTPLTLTSDLHAGLEFGQRDENGRIVPRERQTHFNYQVPIDCATTDGAIKLGFYVQGRIPAVDISTLADPERRDVSGAAMVAKSAFAHLPKIRTWPLYGSTEIRVTEPFAELPRFSEPLSMEVFIFPETSEALASETNLRRSVRRAFEKAKDFLYEALGCSPHGREAEIRSAARFFEACRRGRAADYGCWLDDYGHRDLMPEIEHWLRLKNPTHPKVRAADNARQLIYPTHFPEYWAIPLPQPALYGVEWLQS